MVTSSGVSLGEKDQPGAVGRYVLFKEVARGRTASVHLARLRGVTGFARTVIIRRLLPAFTRDPELARMFVDEARLAARVRHPNVVSVLDVVGGDGGEPFVVMEYIHGQPLSQLIKVASRQRVPMPRRVLVTIVAGILNGLDAAHEARDDKSASLDIVHEDVSPQKVLLGANGVPMVFAFGHAKTARRARSKEPGSVQGKLGYLAPEQLAPGPIDRGADIYAAGVMLWEGLTGRRLFDTRLLSEKEVVLAKNTSTPPAPPSTIIPSTSKTLDEIVTRALSRSRGDRFETAGEMAVALENALSIVPNRRVGEWVTQVAGKALEARAAEVREIEALDLPVASGASSGVSIQIVSAVDVLEVEDRPPESEEGGVSLLPAATTTPPRSAPDAGLDLVAMMPGPLPIIRVPRIDLPRDAPARSSPPEPSPPVTPRRFGWGTGLTCAGLLVGAIWILGPRLTESSEPGADLPVVGTDASGAAPVEGPRGHERPSPLARGPSSDASPCEPPFTIDPQGFRVPKPECVH